MAVLNEISVGGIIYQEIDSIPTHSATYGVVAFDKKNGRVFNFNGSGWELMMRPRSGRIFHEGNVTTLTDTNNTNWVAHTGTTNVPAFNEEDLLGFTSSNPDSLNGELKINSIEDIGRYMITVSSTLQSNGQIYVTQIAPVIDGATPVNYIQSAMLRVTAGQRNNITSVRIADLLTNSRVSMSKRYIAAGGGGDPGYYVRNTSIQVIKVEEPIIEYTLKEDWNSATFSNWTVVNSTGINRWVVGTATSFSGSYSAYISNNGGLTNTYTITGGPNPEVSHFYKDITIPNESGDFYLYFKWKSWGENSVTDVTFYDFGSVVVTTTATTPVANVEVSTTSATILSGGPTGSGRIGATTNSGKFNENYPASRAGVGDNLWRSETILLNNYKGLTRRIVFTWRQDNLTGDNPPFALDNISIFKKLYI